MNKIIIIIQLGLLISSNCHASTIQPKEDINEKGKKNDIINNLPKEYYTNTASNGFKITDMFVDYDEVANEVETEQMVGEEPLMAAAEHGLYTSMVQVRGSIPLHWCHENLSMPKPDFLLWKQDSTYKAASLHFDNLAQRYPEPIVSLNLIKQEETGRPKETLLFDEYTNCIRYLNKQLQKQTYETK